MSRNRLWPRPTTSRKANFDSSIIPICSINFCYPLDGGKDDECMNMVQLVNNNRKLSRPNSLCKNHPWHGTEAVLFVSVGLFLGFLPLFFFSLKRSLSGRAE